MGRLSASARPKTCKATTTRHQAPPGHSGQSKGQAPASVNHPGKTCLFCGQRHPMLKSKCPAYWKACNKCGKANHLSTCCPTSKKPARKVNAVGHDRVIKEATPLIPMSTMYTTGLQPVHYLRRDDIVPGKAVKFRLDTGAAANVLPLSILAPGTKVKPSSKILKTYDGSTLSTKGTAKVNLINPQTRAVTPRNHL